MLHSFAALAALSCIVQAFPTLNPSVFERRQDSSSKPTPFDPAVQYVSVSGDHAFQPPNVAAGDQRGPCPGLNAMANHNYIPRSGVASHAQFISGTHDAYGMTADLAGVLTVLGATVDGNGLEWSIGGPSPHLPAVAGLLGQPQGISASHNKYETDVSPGRGDLYTHGDDWNLQLDQYQQLHDMAMANGDNITMPLLTEFRSRRFDNSVATNPYFWNGPVTGILVQPAAYYFIFRLFGNHSAEYPDGYLTTELMNTFFGVQRDPATGALSLISGGGHERIPDNFYKRNPASGYGIHELNVDTNTAAEQYPKFFDIGGNLGRVDSFTGVDFANLTNGAYNLQTLAQGDNLPCFLSEMLAQVTPDMVRCSGVLGDLDAAMKRLDDQLAQSFAGLTCQKLSKLDTDQFKGFPGYTDLDCRTGTYKK